MCLRRRGHEYLGPLVVVAVGAARDAMDRCSRGVVLDERVVALKLSA